MVEPEIGEGKQMKRYLASELVPGQFSEFEPIAHRVDPDPGCPPTLRDKLARLISNAYSPQPGRLCLVKNDYRAADDVMTMLRREGIDLRERE